MRNLAVLPAFLLLCAAPAWADWTPMTAKNLGALCHSGDAAKHAQCIGYVTGIYDLQFSPKPPTGVCPPANFDPDLLAAVVTAYVDTHDDGPAPEAIGQSIVRFFPCVGGAPKR